MDLVISLSIKFLLWQRKSRKERWKDEGRERGREIGRGKNGVKEEGRRRSHWRKLILFLKYYRERKYHVSLKKIQVVTARSPLHPPWHQPALGSSYLLLPLRSPPTYLHWRQNQRWCQKVGCGPQTESWWLSSVDHWRLVKWIAELDTHRTSQLGWPRQKADGSWPCASQLQQRPNATIRTLFLAES